MSWVKFSVGLCLCALVMSAPAARAATTTPPPVKLFLLGDSITYQAMQVAPLTAGLTAAGYAPTTLAVKGYPGYLIDGTNVGSPAAGLYENLPTIMDTPGVNSANTYILLNVGVNDVEKNFLLGEHQVRYRMNRLIEAVRGYAPLAHIIVGTIIPNLRDGRDERVRKFNADILPVLTGPNLTWVDMYGPFQPDPSPYMYLGTDKMHPTQAGHDLIAAAWLGGIQAIAPTPAPEPGVLALIGVAGPSLFSRRARRRATL
ncbi:MAG TPA: GDSL-type esterase/lipase family protein [Tepidisphaeraceae bacterium]|nr:GDSL-type esterase/lipase family protein [Tepidisphaeraceae bacterium]